MPRRLVAEAFGTFALTLAAAAVEAAARVHPEITHAERAGAPALMVLALIYALSDVSGAHFNPAVTLSFALRGVFPWRRLPAYWTAQLAGSVLAAAVTVALFGRAADAGATLPRAGALASLALEALLTLLLVAVILHTSRRHAVVGPTAALAVAGVIALGGFWGGPLSGAAMNPARSFGPALLAHELAVYWIYAVGPIAGAAGAVALTYAIRGPASDSEEEAAEGDADETRA
jgi:MIP family channel proteins